MKTKSAFLLVPATAVWSAEHAMLARLCMAQFGNLIT